MSWSGSSPLAVVRDGMWGLLLFTGVAWLAIAWSVLRLEPADIVHVAGPVILFAALAEGLRACAGARTWRINAGLAGLFAVTGVVLLAGQDTSYTTPAALIGWYLMVRGAVDVAVATVTRRTGRIWGLLMVVGVLETALGFFAASPLSRAADPVVVVLGALGLLRAVAELVTGLRLREGRAPRSDLLDLSPERADGVAGYAAGLSDYESQPVRTGPRHRAAHRLSATRRTAADVIAGGIPAAGGTATAEHVTADAQARTAPAAHVPGTGGPAGSGPVAHVPATGEPVRGGDTFHDEVLRTTADLDAMLALAGVTGAGVAARLPDHDIPEVPDTPEGVGLPDDDQPTLLEPDETAEIPVATVRAAHREEADRPAGGSAHHRDDPVTARGGTRND